MTEIAIPFSGWPAAEIAGTCPDASAPIVISPCQIEILAAKFRANPVALALAVESQGVGADPFRLPTRHLEHLDFLADWTRQNYRTAIAKALELGLFERVGPPHRGRAGARYRLKVGTGNGWAVGPACGRAA